MIIWLNQDQNTRWHPNENYARELMELFTLGADRGAYTEGDVRELARALTGWASDWTPEEGNHNFRFVAGRHDPGNKTVFGRTGNVELGRRRAAVHHPPAARVLLRRQALELLHRHAAVGRRLARRSSGSTSRAATRCGRCWRRSCSTRICTRASAWSSRRWCSWPACSARLRRSVEREDLIWQSDDAGQRLFYPPDVSGWDDSRWLDTMTVKGRWEIVRRAVRGTPHHRLRPDRLQRRRDARAGGGGGARVLGRARSDERDARRFFELRRQLLPRHAAHRHEPQPLPRLAPERAAAS